MSYLPPTSNFLDQEERTRLVKSTRKLEALLGVAPHLLEGDSPSLDAIRRSSEDSSRSSYDSDVLDIPSRSSSRASNRSARVYSSARASFISFDVDSDSEDDCDDDASPEPSPLEAPKASLSYVPSMALEHQAKRVKKSIEPSLFLQLHAPAHFASNDSSTDLFTAIPLSPISPLSPTMTINVQADVEGRRRKMAAKLTRTLGENIPPELVCTPAPLTARPTRQRSSSIDDRHFSNQLPKRPSVQGAFRPAPVQTRAPSQMYETVTIQIPRNIGKYYASESADEVRDLRPSASRQRSLGANLKRGRSARAQGKNWSGEWNHEMEDVMSKLRTLKA